MAEALVEDVPSFAEIGGIDDLLWLSARLPSGLVFAEGIWIVAQPPPGLVPLAPGSAWFAFDRSLVVAVPPGEARVTDLLADLGRYALAASWVQARLEAEPALVEVLLSPQRSPALGLRLALALKMRSEDLVRLDREAPGLWADLAAMARRGFAPAIHVHGDLHPDRLARAGQALADTMLQRLPVGPFVLAVSDGRLLPEHLSPYVRDLGHALAAWGRENPGALRTDGLLEAIRAAPEAPDADHGALVAEDLFRLASDLLEERRGAESSQGLFLRDELGTTAGWAEVARLAAPDGIAVPRPGDGIVAVLAGGAPELLRAAFRGLVASGRVTGVLSVLGAAVDASAPVVPEAVVTESDGFELRGAAELWDRAQRIGIGAQRAGCLEVGAIHGAPRLAAELLGVVRRARVQGTLGRDVPAYVVLFPRAEGARRPGLTLRKVELAAGRLGLATLLVGESQNRTGGQKTQAVPGGSRITRRFRA